VQITAYDFRTVVARNAREFGSADRSNVDLARWSRLARFVLGRVRLYTHEWRRSGRGERNAYLRAKLRMIGEMATRRDVFRGDPSELRVLAVREANRCAGRRCVPAPYDGPVALALTDGRVPTGTRNRRLDWLELVPQGGPPRYVPGKDTGDMLVPPNVYALATCVNEWLDEAHAHENAADGVSRALRAAALADPQA
jgi:hypothetical protein